MNDKPSQRTEYLDDETLLSMRLNDLLAIIHADGGHYQAEHGDEKAYNDAVTKYYALVAQLEEARTKIKWHEEFWSTKKL